MMKRMSLSALWVCLSLPATSLASPWLDSDALNVRQSLEALSHAGVISRPVNTYPLMWQGIAQDLHDVNPNDLPAHLQFALRHLKTHLKAAMRSQHSGVALAYHKRDEQKPTQDNGFGEKALGKYQVASFGAMTGQHVAAKVKVTHVEEGFGLGSTKLDGSYLAVKLADWSLSAEKIAQHWGPSSHNSLIMAKDAAPMTGVRVTRTLSEETHSVWLNWLGKWQLTGFAAKQQHPYQQRFAPEGDTYFEADENTLVAGRFEFMPLPGLTLALSQLKGYDANQKAHSRNAFDVSYHIPKLPLSLYGQAAKSQNHTDTLVGLKGFYGGEHFIASGALEWQSLSDCNPVQCAHITHKQEALFNQSSMQGERISLHLNYVATHGQAISARISQVVHQQTRFEQVQLGYQTQFAKGRVRTSIGRSFSDDSDNYLSIGYEIQF